MAGNSAGRGAKSDRLIELENIDAVCDQFEAEWQRGAEPRILDCLADWAEPGRTQLLRELVTIDIVYRSKLAGGFSSSRYLSLFPPNDSWLAELLKEHSTRNEAAASQDTVDPSSLRSRASVPPVRQDMGGTFADYELLEPLGQGGMGVVYRARQLSLKRMVALKMIARAEFAGPDEIQRFRAEAEAAARLDHPGIVPVYDYGECDGRQYFSMALVEGDSLRERIQQKGPLDGKPAAQLVHKLALAVESAHQQGIIHRDLKPSNVLLSSDDSPRITDFGLAKLQAAKSGLTQSGQILGTPSYMSPEQARGETTIDQRSDVYGLGAILYFVMTGRPPFQAATISQTLHQVCELDPVAPRSLNPAIPKDLETIALKCLSKVPAHRYESAKQLAEDLSRFQESKTITARPVSHTANALRWSRRNPLAVTIALLVVAGMLVGWLVALDYEHKAQEMEALLLQNQIDELTDSNDWTMAELDAVEEKERRLAQLSRSAHLAAQERITKRMAESIDFQMKSLRGELPEHQEQVEQLLARLAARDPDAASALQTRLQDLLALPQVVIDFNADQHELSSLFVNDDATNLEHATSVKSAGSVEAEMAVDIGSWDLAQPVGIIIDHQTNNGPASGSMREFATASAAPVPMGYYFLIRGLPQDTSLEAATTVAETNARGTDEQTDVLMQLYRGSVLLRQRRVPLMADADQITLVANKELQKLKFTFRQGRPGDEAKFEFSFDDLFDIGAFHTGVFAVSLPSGNKLLSMRARSQLSTVERDESNDEIVRAKELIQQNRLQEASAIFGEIANRSQSVAARHEFLLRSSLVNPDPAEERKTLELITAGGESRFVTPARCRLLLRYIEDQDFANADTTLGILSLAYTKEELATLLPDEDRGRIVDAYLDRTRTGGYDVVRRDYKYDKQLELILSIHEMMGGVSDDQLIITKGSLMIIYQMQDRLSDALRLSSEMLADVNVYTSQDLGELMNRRIWILIQMDKAADGIRDIDTVLASENPNEQDRSSLLIQKARALAHLNRLPQAQEVLDQYFEVAEKETDSEVRWWLDASLVGGFLRELNGDPDGAMQLWTSAFRVSQSHDQIVQVYDHSMLGGLTGQLDAAEANRILNEVMGAGFGKSAIMQFIKNGLMPDDWVLMALKNIWQTERGHRAAKEVAFHELSADRANFIQVLLTGAELYRYQVQLSPDLQPALSVEDDLIIWQLMEDGLACYRANEISEQDLAQETMAHLYPSILLPWNNIKDRLPQKLRGPMAYIHGCHYAHTAATSSFDKASAIQMFELAIADAESTNYELLKSQAEARLANLKLEQSPEN